ncbi:hypothetical protein IAT40_007224 [Kwoniella sp. CBS 6097]
MPLREADLSATPIDDGSLAPLDTAPSSSSSSSSFLSSRGPNDYANPTASPSAAAPGSQANGQANGPRPMSPQPKLVLFDPRSGQQETIDLGGSASSIMTLDDYKRLSRRTTERGIITGLIGGGLLTYLVKRFMPKTRTPSRNALSLTFIFSSSFISFSTSRGLLVSEILKIRAQARQKAIDNGELPGGDNAPPSDSMFGDTSSGSGAESGSGVFGSADNGNNGFGRGFRNTSGSGTGTSPRDLRSPENESRRDSPSAYTPPGYRRSDDRDVTGAGPGVAPTPGANSMPSSRQGMSGGNVRDEISRLGQGQGGASIGNAPQRTRWAKGRGLEGEVEEEGEMRDPYAAPGQPRLG